MEGNLLKSFNLILDMIQANETSLNAENNFDNVEAEKVPEAISKAVASLPPEQMFELMKQMKQCIQVVFTHTCFLKVKHTSYLEDHKKIC